MPETSIQVKKNELRSTGGAGIWGGCPAVVTYSFEALN
jgi:hypothetical protein